MDIEALILWETLRLDLRLTLSIFNIVIIGYHKLLDVIMLKTWMLNTFESSGLVVLYKGK